MKTLSVSMKHLVQYWHYQHFGHQYHPLTQTNNLLVTINSSVNFIIYCIFGHKFKRIFLSLVCSLVRGRGRPRPGDLSRVYTWASISLHVYIRVTSGGLLRFHSQHKMSHQQEHSHVSLQLAVTQPGDTRWEYSVTRVIHTCHVSVFCAKTPKVPHYMHCIVSLSEHWRWRMQNISVTRLCSAATWRTRRCWGRARRSRRRSWGAAPARRRRSAASATRTVLSNCNIDNIFYTFSSLKNLIFNNAFALGNLFIETIIMCWFWILFLVLDACPQIYLFMSGFGSLQIKQSDGDSYLEKHSNFISLP